MRGQQIQLRFSLLLALTIFSLYPYMVEKSSKQFSGLFL